MGALSRVRPSDWVDELFVQFGARYGERLARMWGGQSLAVVKRVWRDELAGYGREDLERGLMACRARDYPPSLPEFLRMCRPELDAEVAYHEAVEQMVLRAEGRDRWSSPVVYWAAVRIGGDLQSTPWPTIRKRWSAALEQAERDVLSDALPAQIPERHEALSAPGKLAMSQERGKELIAHLRARLAGKVGVGGRGA